MMMPTQLENPSVESTPKTRSRMPLWFFPLYVNDAKKPSNMIVNRWVSKQ